jgi:transmembrane sensor
MEKARLHSLLHPYLNNTINIVDCEELLNHLKKTDPAEIEHIIDTNLLDLNEGPAFGAEQSRKVFDRIKSDSRFSENSFIASEKPITYKLLWLKIAAAALVFFTAGIFIIRHNKIAVINNKQANNMKPSVIVPGSQKAVLTMANGKVIILGNANNGMLAKTGISTVLKTHNGQIVYQIKSASPVADNLVSYNTLTTPKRGEYQVILPDGTKVWLNAASSITYPTAFTGNERHVKLSGEAYFEVAKNKQKPFYVSMNNVQVRVLGTHFNIAAYSDDDAITTTLLEGSVQITKNSQQSLLKPGQQGVVNNDADKILVSEANIDDAMAWKNGYFLFNDDNITTIMKKVSRWYDVDIDYRGKFDDQKFGGTYYRSKSITELLQYLEMVGKIHFKITGRRITVMN